MRARDTMSSVIFGEQCSFSVAGNFKRACTDDAKWRFDTFDGQQGQTCYRHLLYAKDQYPNSTFVPIDSENR